jgi:hypothetical protein
MLSNFQPHVQPPRPQQVAPAEARNPLAVDALQRHILQEGQPREDGGLVLRVVAVHIAGRVGFGVAVLLRLAQGARVGGLGGFARVEGALHLAQDEVRGAVDDADHALDAVARQCALQRVQDGQAACDARLVQQAHALPLRQAQQLVARNRHHPLVGGNHMLARLQRVANQCAGRLQPAHQFQHDMHLRVA